MTRFLADDELLPAHVPGPAAPWTEVERFALTFQPGAGGMPALDACSLQHERAGTLPVDLASLRGILLVEQRRHRHWGRVPSGSGLERIRHILSAIRACVAGRQSVPPAEQRWHWVTDTEEWTAILDPVRGVVRWCGSDKPRPGVPMHAIYGGEATQAFHDLLALGRSDHCTVPPNILADILAAARKLARR